MPGFLPPSTADPNYGFGETLVATLDHTSRTPYDCVSLGAIVMSTAIKDVDGDGAADGIEDGIATAGATSTPVTKDADGTALPNLSAMNGSSHHKDIYFQMDAMQDDVSRHTYGDPLNAPFPGVAEMVNGVVTHRTAQPPAESGRREDHHRHVSALASFTNAA